MPLSTHMFINTPSFHSYVYKYYHRIYSLIKLGRKTHSPYTLKLDHSNNPKSPYTKKQKDNELSPERYGRDM